MDEFRILVVDDEPATRRLMQVALEPDGYRVFEADSFKEALKQLERQRLDLVFTDVVMPGGADGLDLLETIKAKWPSTEVIVVTAFATLDIAVSAIRGGAHDFVTKPYHLDLLRAAVQRVRNKVRLDRVRHLFIERVIAATEEERRRIARELHDDAGQSLTLLSLELRALDEETVDERLKTRLRALHERAVAVIDEVGRLARGLHPRVIEELGFEAAIRDYAEETMNAAGVRLDLHFNGLQGRSRLPEPVEITLYRIVQEALTNIAKHADATAASVLVERRPGRVRAIVEDNGCGFQCPVPPTLSPGLGLHSIRERAKLLEGCAVIESTPKSGTTIYVEVPLGA